MTNPLLECAAAYMRRFRESANAHIAGRLADFARIVQDATMLHDRDATLLHDRHCKGSVHTADSCQADIAKRVTARLEGK